MKKSKFTENQITKALKEYEGGRSVEDICRELGVKPPTFYVWKRYYAIKLPTRGIKEYFKRIRRSGLPWNHKRVKRVYVKLGLSRRRKMKRRLPSSERQPLLQPIAPNLT